MYLFTVGTGTALGTYKVTIRIWMRLSNILIYWTHPYAEREREGKQGAIYIGTVL